MAGSPASQEPAIPNPQSPENPKSLGTLETPKGSGLRIGVQSFGFMAYGLWPFRVGTSAHRHSQPRRPSLNLDTFKLTEVSTHDWVLVYGLNLSYRNKETILFTIDPYYGNLN